MIPRLLKFSVAGAGGLVIQMAALAVFTQLGIHYIPSAILAIELAILANFVGHEWYTWKDRSAASAAGQVPSARLVRLLRYNALTGVTSIVGGVLVTAVLVERMSMSPIAASLVSIAALGVVNFAGANALVFRSGIAAALLAVAANSYAGETAILKTKTALDFAKYVAAVEARRTQSIADNEPFLDIERQPPAQLARTMAGLKRGEVIVSRGAARDASSNEISIDGGLINHWRGTVFVPNVKLDTVMKVLQEPQTDRHKQEDVISSRVVSRDGDSQKVFLRLRRTKFVTVVYDTEYDVDYQRLGPDRALSNSISTKVVEIENAGTPKERALPEGNDHGFLWRLNTYWRYKQVDGGVLVEIESLTLSRPLPAIIGTLIRPIITSTARESMTRTLASVRARFAS